MRDTFFRWWPAIVLTALFLWLGARGLDYGHHWDEPWFFAPVKRFARNGDLLPHLYNYPSLSYYLSFLAGLPELIAGLFDDGPAYRKLVPVLDAQWFRMRTRALFLSVTALTVPCVYGGILATGRSRAAAVAGTLALIGSFEVSYHARWIAPDGPLLAATALGVWAAAASTNAQTLRSAVQWRRWATVAAGLATGTKYTAGLLLIPPLLLALRARSAADSSRSALTTRLVAVAETVVLFAVVYLITTPATLFDTQLFLEHIEAQRKTYGGGFGPYTVNAGFDHLSRMLLYFTGALGSVYAPIAFMMSAVSAVGAVQVVRDNRKLALSLFLFPALFVLYFAIQRTMIVRNLLVIVPSAVIAFAWGVDAIWSWAGPHRARRAAVAIVVGGMLAVNIAFVSWAAETVHGRKDLAAFERAAADFIEGHASTFVSPRLRQRFALRGIELSRPTVASARDAEWLVFETDEGFAHRGQWPPHVWGLTETWFGPWEVNFHRYPTWDGDSRIVVMRQATARAIKLPLLKTPGQSPSG